MAINLSGLSFHTHALLPKGHASGAAAFAVPQGPGDVKSDGQGPGPGLEQGQMPGQGPGAEQRHQGPGAMQGQRPMMPPVERLKELGATDLQIQALKDAAYEQDKQMITLRANVERAEIELRHLMDAATADKKAITETLDALGTARSELFKAETLNMLKVRETLGEKLFSQMRQPPQRQGGPGAQGGRGGQGGPTGRPQPPQQPDTGMQGHGGTAGGEQ